MPETPEQKARHDIDAKLIASGWLVQNRDDLDLTAGRGIAVREFPMKSGFGFADYLLYLDRKAVGAVEAKAAGTLTGVEAQSAKYAAGLPDNLPAHRRPLPFLFESNGAVTFFTNGLDPKPRSRKVYSFPRPETLAEWVDFKKTVVARVGRDAAFAKEILEVAATLLLGGDAESSRVVLNQLVSATLGFEQLAKLTNVPSKSLHRMLSPKGNPRMDNLALILGVLSNNVSRGARNAKPRKVA